MLSAEITKIMLPFIALKFISGSVSLVSSAFEKQKITLLINFTLLFFLFITMAIKINFSLDALSTIRLYSIVFAILYLIFIFIYWKIIRAYELKKLI